MKICDIIFVILVCISVSFVDINKQFFQGVVTTGIAAWYISRRIAGKF